MEVVAKQQVVGYFLLDDVLKTVKKVRIFVALSAIGGKCNGTLKQKMAE